MKEEATLPIVCIFLFHTPLQIWVRFGDPMHQSLSCPADLFHTEVLLLKLIEFPLEVEVLLFLHDLPLLRHGLILVEEPLGFVMNEVTQDFK